MAADDLGVGPLERELTALLDGAEQPGTQTVSAVSGEAARTVFLTLSERERAERYVQLRQAILRLAREIDERSGR
jgi:hypothetical protein